MDKSYYGSLSDPIFYFVPAPIRWALGRLGAAGILLLYLGLLVAFPFLWLAAMVYVIPIIWYELKIEWGDILAWLKGKESP